MNKEMKLYTRIALVVATFVATLHALWAILVGLGVGQSVMNWVFPLHFINSIYIVLSFDWMTAAFLVVMSFVGSYIATLLFMWLWKMIKVK